MNAIEGTVSVQEILNYIDSDRYLSKAESMHFLADIGERTFEGLKDIPSYKIGSRRCWKKSELETWMQKHREAPESLDSIVNECVKAVAV